MIKNIKLIKIKFLLFALITTTLTANENFINMKSCESVKLSNLTTLVSCHRIDYLIEYRNIDDDDEKDNIKKITALTVQDNKIIKSIKK